MRIYYVFDPKTYVYAGQYVPNTITADQYQAITGQPYGGRNLIANS